MTWHAPVHSGEARANLQLDRRDMLELDNRIRTALGYMKPEKIANYLGVTLAHVLEVRNRSRYYRVKGLREQVTGGVRRG